MIALLKKDWRLNRIPVFGTLALIAATYFICVVLDRLFESFSPSEHNIRETLEAASTLSIVITATMAAAFGGAAFAAERRERSANFVAMLPVTRARIITSKAIIAIASVAFFFVLNVAIIILVTRPANRPRYDQDILEFVKLMLGATVMSFGVAWALSTFLHSAAIAAVASIAVTICVLANIAVVCNSLNLNESLIFNLAFKCGLSCGIVGLIVGTICYLRRVEP